MKRLWPGCLGKIPLVLCLTVVAGGCFDKVELNEIAVVDMMAIDLSPDGRFTVAVQTVIPGALTATGGGGGAGGGSHEATPFYVMEATGATLPEAFSFLQSKMSRRLFTSHLQVIILGEELARGGVGPLFDSLTRMRELRVTMELVVTRGRGADLLHAAPRLSKLPAAALTNLLRNDIVPNQTIREFVVALAAQGADPFLPVIALASRMDNEGARASTSDADNGTAAMEEFEVTGIALFQGDRLVGFADRYTARGLAWLINQVLPGTTTVEWPAGERHGGESTGSSEWSPAEDDAQRNAPPGAAADSPGAGTTTSNRISPMLLRGNVRIYPHVGQGKVSVTVRARAEQDIAANQAGLDLTDPNIVPRLEAILAADIEHRMRAMIDTAQRLQSDVFGFGELIHRELPHVWRELKKNWHETFANLAVDIDVEVKVRRAGLSNRPASLREEQLRR